MTYDDAVLRINSQMSTLEKMNKSNVVIWTGSSDLDNIRNQVRIVWYYVKGNL